MRQLAGVAVVAAMLLSALGLSMSDHSILKADIVARVKHAAPTRLWVEFRDKGCVDHSDISFLRSLLDTLHPEAKKRREIHMKAHLRLHSSVPLDYHDVPVCPDYIRAVETIEGWLLITASRSLTEPSVTFPTKVCVAFAWCLPS